MQEVDGGGQRIQTSNCKVSKFRELDVQCGDYN